MSHWLSQGRALLARAGLRLLAIELIVTVCALVPMYALLATGVVDDLPVLGVFMALLSIPTSFIAAWVWSVELLILSEDPAVGAPRMTIGQALRGGLSGGRARDVMRLWGWLLLFKVFSIPSLLLYFDVGLMMEFAHSPIRLLIGGLSWYVTFATALLPMAILLERRGIARAWRLSHRRLSTAVAIAALLVLGWIVDWLVNELSGTTERVVSVVIGLALSVPMTIAFYVVYLARVEAAAPPGDDQHVPSI